MENGEKLRWVKICYQMLFTKITHFPNKKNGNIWYVCVITTSKCQMLNSKLSQLSQVSNKTIADKLMCILIINTQNTFVDYNKWLIRLDTQLNKQTNQNLQILQNC